MFSSELECLTLKLTYSPTQLEERLALFGSNLCVLNQSLPRLANIKRDPVTLRTCDVVQKGCKTSASSGTTFR